MTPQETDAAVDALLAEAGIKYEAVYQGVSPAALGGNSDMDKWAITLASQQFEFFTGLGLRAPATAAERLKATEGFNSLTGKDRKGLTMYGRHYLAEVEKLRKPKPPTAAWVLQHLLLDAQASVMTFSTWCADFDFDEDSRKAFEIYTFCQDTSDKLNKVMGGTLQQKIAELLQDY